MKKKRRHIRKRHTNNSLVLIVILLLAVVLVISYIVTSGFSREKLITQAAPSQQQGTFQLITPTPTPISTGAPVAHVPLPTGVVGPLPIGGAASPNDPFYCIDDEDPEGCDDNTAFHVPKGVGGAAGTCDNIMINAHKVVRSLPDPQLYLKAMRDSLNPAVANNCHNTGTYSSPNYISTFFVIDTYNLTGFKELSKSNAAQVTGAGMLSWWKAQQAPYKFIPYTPTVLSLHASGVQDLTGCVVFINLPSGGVHVGIFNVLQLVNSNGDGVVSILQSGTRFMLDRFMVVGWDVKNTPLHQTNITGFAGFGCHI